MNINLQSGNFKKTAGSDKFIRFKVAVKRPYKDKETGKYGYDYPSFVCFSSNKTGFDFIDKFIKEKDIVEVESHVQTGSYEKDGKTVYTQDLVVDAIRIVANGTGSAAEGEKGGTSTAAPESEVEVNDEDCPW